MAKKKKALEGKYAWKKGGGEFKSYDPASVYAEILSVQKEKGHDYKAADLVDAAESGRFPILGKIFDRDDEHWVREGKLELARRLVRSIDVIVIRQDQPEMRVRAVFSKPVDGTNDRRYTDTLETLSEEEGRQVILRQAWLQILSWKKRYKHLSELAQVFDAIDVEHDRFLKRSG